MKFKYQISTLALSALALLFGFTSCVNDDLEKSCPAKAISFTVEAQLAPMHSPVGALHTRAIEGTNRNPVNDPDGNTVEGDENENYVGNVKLVIWKDSKNSPLFDKVVEVNKSANTISVPVKLIRPVAPDDKLHLRMYANYKSSWEGSFKKLKDLYGNISTPTKLATSVELMKIGLPMVSPEYTFSIREHLWEKNTNKLSEADVSATSKNVKIGLERAVARVRVVITNTNPKTGKPYKGVETLTITGLKGFGLDPSTSPYKENLKDRSGKDGIEEEKLITSPVSLKEPVRIVVVDRYVPDYSLTPLRSFTKDSYACYFLATLKGADPVGNLGNFEPGGEIGDTRATVDVTVGNSSDLLFKIYSNFNNEKNFAIVRNTFYDFTANIRGRNKSDFTLKLEVPDYVEEQPVDIIIKDY